MPAQPARLAMPAQPARGASGDRPTSGAGPRCADTETRLLSITTTASALSGPEPADGAASLEREAPFPVVPRLSRRAPPALPTLIGNDAPSDSSGHLPTPNSFASARGTKPQRSVQAQPLAGPRATRAPDAVPRRRAALFVRAGTGGPSGLTLQRRTPGAAPGRMRPRPCPAGSRAAAGTPPRPRKPP
jgi:hypothetical protein